MSTVDVSEHVIEVVWPAELEPDRRRARRWREVVERHLRPLEASAPRGRVNRALVGALGEHGFLRELFPGEGSVASASRLCLLKEVLAQRSTAAEDALGLQGLGYYPIQRWGTAAQRRPWYERVVAGDAVVAFAMSEPEAGSDVGGMRLTAARADGGWVLNGTKIWISNAPDADVYVVFARTGEGRGGNALGAFVVPAHAPGLRGEPIDLLVSHPVGRLEFVDVEVGDDALLGDASSGWEIGLETLNLFRISVGAASLGMAEAALEATLEHVGCREQFGRPLKSQQAVAHQLAEMRTGLAAARLLTYHAARMHDQHGSNPALAAMAKINATETAQRVVDAAVQLHGARGLQEGHLVGHLYREVRALRIYEGATEVLRNVVARGL